MTAITGIVVLPTFAALARPILVAIVVPLKIALAPKTSIAKTLVFVAKD
jgi:hypothetical protein